MWTDLFFCSVIDSNGDNLCIAGGKCRWCDSYLGPLFSSQDPDELRFSSLLVPR